MPRTIASVRRWFLIPLMVLAFAFAWRNALAHPERIDALLLLDAGGAPLRAGENAPPLNLGFRLARMKILRPLLEQVTPRSLVKKSVLQTVEVDRIVTEEMVDRYWELLRFPGNRRATALRNDTDREIGVADRLAEITAPTLILWGEQDKLVWASAADAFAKRRPQPPELRGHAD